jgi:hypothetical protein
MKHWEIEGIREIKEIGGIGKIREMTINDYRMTIK